MATETDEVKLQTAVADPATSDGSSTTDTLPPEDAQSQASPDLQTTERAGDVQDGSEPAEEPKTEADEDKTERKSRTAKQFQRQIAQTREAQAATEQALEKARVAEDEVVRLKAMPSSAAPFQQQAQPQLLPEQTSDHWARKWHEANQNGTATPEQLQDYANRYHGFHEQENGQRTQRLVQQQIQEHARQAQVGAFVNKELAEINTTAPFYHINAQGQTEILTDSPVLNAALAQAKAVGVQWSSWADALPWLTRAHRDLLLAGASAEKSAANQLRHKTQEVMSRTGLEAGGSGHAPGPAVSPIEKLSGEDLWDAATRQIRSRKKE